ncbi:MAG: hypothetical protein JW866_06430 [Ignavibacteriales bacterium]|nr:hypothetical protein [Ignavibacteriales bacterium]
MWRINKVWLFTIIPFLILGTVFIILGFNAEPWELTDDGYPLDTFWFIMGGSFIFFSFAPLLIISIWNKRKIKKIQNLLDFGIRGTAKILDAVPTGTEINNIPMIRLNLEVSIPGREKYNVTHKELINPMYYPFYTPGKILNIIIDRDKPNVLMIDTTKFIEEANENI